MPNRIEYSPPVSYGYSPSAICGAWTTTPPNNPPKNLAPPACANPNNNISPNVNGSPTSNSNGAIGNPINPGTGDKFQTETDYIGGAGLGFQRTYHSSDYTLQSTHGAHWRHSYERRVNFKPDNDLSKNGFALVIRPSGQQLVFTRAVRTTVWTTDADINDKLESVTSADGIARLHYTLADGSLETYDATGKLLSLKTRTGYSQTFVYSTADTPAAIAPLTDFEYERDIWMGFCEINEMNRDQKK